MNIFDKEHSAEQVDRGIKKKAKNDHFIIAIGASAGGLEVIHDFFDNMTVSDNLSFVVIQHLSPDYKSLLVELVSKHTDMQVFEAQDGITVERKCIYVIPPKKIMKIADGKLQLSEKQSSDKGPNTAIDIFLHTLAEDKKEKAIAVILSGTGTDGTKGIESIKKCGGLSIVQDPESARFDGMPRSAIISGFVDMILTPEQMPGEILSYINDDLPTGIFKDNKIDEHLLDMVFNMVYKKTGCDFHNYKLPTLLRRIARRMLQLGYKKIDEYISLLKEDSEECATLGSDFLIGVTRFFRDKDAYTALYKEVFPQIVADKEDEDIIKIWVSACSTGEEAYSIAILLDKYLKSKNKNLIVKIFATDIDSGAIETAAHGQYPLNIENDIAPDILEDYFIKGTGRYAIIPEIRKQIVFAKHNIIKDPPFIKNDLATCRNMLIYMNPSLQKRVLSVLQYSLNKTGFLFLGSSETVVSVKDTLDEVNRKWKIYRRKEGSQSKLLGYEKLQEYHNVSNLSKQETDQHNNHRSNKTIVAQSLADDFQKTLSEELGYTALYIDKYYEIKEAAGDFRKFLSLPDRFMNPNLLKMVSPAIGAAIGSAVRKAWHENAKTVSKNVLVSENGVSRYIDIIVKPGNNNFTHTLVIIGENSTNAIAAGSNRIAFSPDSASKAEQAILQS